jgi:hypothetical protein
MSQWFIQHRQGFIADCLRVFGQVNRATIVERFDISEPQASLDIQRFLREHPEAMVYDGRCKAYVADADALSAEHFGEAATTAASDPG